jgi:hypothetical protein
MPNETLAPLSIDEAAALLNAPQKEDDASDQQTASDTPSEDIPLRGGDPPGDGAEQADSDESEAGIEPPRWWNKEAKQRFAELPPDVQAVVFAQEETRERVVSRAKQESADARRLSEAQQAELDRRIAAIDAFLPHAAQQFSGKWDGVDWATLPGQIGAEETLKYRAQFEAEQQMLHAIAQQQAAHEQERLTRFDFEQAARLKTVAPDLTDEKLGPERKARIARDLVERGFAPERIRWMNAEEAAYVNDALKWREAEAKARSSARTTKNQPQRPHVRPTAGVPAQSQQSARLKHLSSKRNLSIDEAAELLSLKAKP